MKRKLLLISCLILLAEISYGKELVSSKNFGVKSSSIEFIENKGQFKYSDGKKAEEVLFVANTEFGRILVKKTGLAFVLRERINQPDDKKRKDRIHLNEQTSEKLEYKVSATEFLFDRANPVTKVETFEEADGYDNYYIGNESFTFVKSYRKLVLKGVYPKIDFVIYTGENKSLEYDFVVNPGADPKQIALKIVNFKETSIDANQNLLIKNDVGTIEHSQHKSFLREKNPANLIQSTFTLGTDNILKFDIPSYNSNEKLIIDPIIRVYGLGWGKAGDEAVGGLAVDSSGNTYICGNTYSSSLEVTINTIFGGFVDAYILKLDPKGYKLWATYFGGSGQEVAKGISVDMNNDVLVCGNSGSKDLELTSFQKKYSGSIDAYLLKLNDKGYIKWSRFVGIDSIPEAGIKVKSDDKYIYMAMYYDDWKNIDSTEENVRLFKFNFDGSIVWQTDFIGTSWDICEGMALDKQGNIYIAGYTGSTDLPNPIGTPYDQDWDGYLAKFDKNGKNLWTKYISSPYWDEANGVTTDDSGFVYVCAGSYAPSLITGKGDRTKSNPQDIIVLKYTPQAKLVWAEYFGSLSNGEVPNGISLDRFNNIYVIGDASNGLSFEDTLEANVYRTDILNDAFFVMKLNNSGNYIWNTFIEGSNWENPVDICIDRELNVIVTGTTNSVDVFDINRGSLYFSSPESNYNVIVFKLANPVVIQSLPKIVCRSSFFEISYIVNDDTLSAQNEMIAELSDEKGSFSNSLIIGRQINNKSGSMKAYIPDNIKLGNKYSIRIRYRDSITTPEDWKNITISDMPEVKINGNQRICKNEITTYHATKDSILEYNWSVDGKGKLISKPDSESVTIEWIEAGQGQAFLSTRKRASGCIQYDTINVTVLPLPEITGDSAFSICINDAPKKLDILKPDGGEYSGKGINNGFFYPDSASVGINKISYSYTNENGCKKIIEISAKVNPKPKTPKISTYADMIVSSEDEGNEWFVNDTLLEGVNGKRISGPKTGKYSARIRDTNGCVSDMSEYLDYISDVVENIHEGFSVQPNPAGYYVEIIVPGDNHTLKGVVDNVRIYNVFGEEVHLESMTINTKLILNVSNLSSGLYLLKIGTIFEKFIKY